MPTRMGFEASTVTLSLAVRGAVRALEAGAVTSSLVVVPSLIIGELLLGGCDRGDQST